MNIRKWVQYTSTLASAVLVLAPMASAEEHSTPPSIVVRYCSGCHGINGRSELPYIPRLAGLNAAYTERKISNFKSLSSAPRVDEAFDRFAFAGRASKDRAFTAEATSHMVGPAHALSEQDLRAAADWYAAQRATPGKSGKRDVVEEGRHLYANGVQNRSVPACQTCHGPEAQGTSTAPRLAGQNAAYMLGQLAMFRRANKAISPMTEIARSLETDQARALTAYLQSH